MKEELGLIEGDRRPLDSSISTFVGFNMVGLIPLIPFMVFMAMGIDSDAFGYSTVFVLCSFFIVGVIKGKIVKKSTISSGFFTLIIGGVAASIAYLIGYGLNFLVQ
jgi:VIT1/CCC1 family predicted Fe2+/Mn2+ transporter